LQESYLNNLIVSYQQGEEAALDEICREFLPLLTSISEKVWYKIKNNADFECRCLIKLKRALLNFDPIKGRARSLIINVITKERSEYINGRRGRYVETYNFDLLGKVDDEGKVTEFDVVDVLANIEDDVVDNLCISEKIALLAQGDPVKLAILNAWKDGIDNDLELSRMLAHSFKGNQESYRKTIQRFRNKCQKLLS
jgi:hypothetical protein